MSKAPVLPRLDVPLSRGVKGEAGHPGNPATCWIAASMTGEPLALRGLAVKGFGGAIEDRAGARGLPCLVAPAVLRPGRGRGPE